MSGEPVPPPGAAQPAGDSGPVFPPGRYGRRRSGRHRGNRWLTALLVVVVAAAGTWLAYRFYQRYGNPPFQPGVPAVTQVEDSSLTVTFRVHKDGGQAAVCQVQAKDHDGAEVGYASVPVPAGRDVTVTYTLSTSRRAWGATVLSCQAAAKP